MTEAEQRGYNIARAAALAPLNLLNPSFHGRVAGSVIGGVGEMAGQAGAGFASAASRNPLGTLLGLTVLFGGIASIVYIGSKAASKAAQVRRGEF